MSKKCLSYGIIPLMPRRVSKDNNIKKIYQKEILIVYILAL